LASHWVAVPYKKLIDSIRKHLGLIGFIVACIGMFFSVIYSIPQIDPNQPPHAEHIFNLYRFPFSINAWQADIFDAGGILWLLGMCIQKTK
jgi:hypothetical protein